jgi:hypothetical protein
MPHIRALFVEDQDGDMKALLREKKTAIRKAVAFRTGYKLEEVAFIPDMVPAELVDLAENLLPLEFIIDAGTQCANPAAGFIAANLKADFIELGLGNANFGIWLRAMTDNSYQEHKPV